MDHERLPPIPEEFRNSETGLPFSRCLVCECDLMKESRPYAIERAIRHYPAMKLENVVFEYALCARCIAQTESGLSVETRSAIMRYFIEHFNHAARPQWNPDRDGETQETPFNIQKWTGTCAVKGLAQSDLHEYSLCALCIGDRIIPDVLPYMVSGQAQEELIELFSNHSLGFLDDFTDRHFSGPPELKELFKGRPMLI